MNLLDRWLPPGSFLRNVTVLTGGTAFAQGLMVLVLPLLTRLYSPQDFNLLAVYAGLIGIITAVSCLRYNIAIPIPDQDADGLALLLIAVIVATVSSLLCALPVIFFPKTAATLLGQPELQPYMWMFPVGVFIASIYNALQFWATRMKRFALLTRTRITRALGGAGTQVSFGIANSSPLGLLLGQMIYGGMGVIGLTHYFLKQDRRLISQIDRQRLIGQGKKFRKYPLYSVPEILFNTAGIQLPLIIIASSSVGHEAGFLFLAMRVMGLPMALIGSSVSQVFLAEAPRKLRDGTLFAFTRRTMWTLFKAGAPIMVASGLISPIIFPLVLGSEWSRAGWLVAWMTPWFVLQFVVSPVSAVLQVQGQLSIAMWINFYGLVLRVGAVVLAIYVAPEFIGEAYAISGLVFVLIYLATILCSVERFSKNSPVSQERMACGGQLSAREKDILK